MKQIKAQYIKGIQRAYMRKFMAEDDWCRPDYRKISANERAINHYLAQITGDPEEQQKILDIIMRQSWNTEDLTYKPIFDKLRELGYEIV